MDSTDMAVDHARNRPQNARDEAGTVRLRLGRPRWRERIAGALQRLAERLEPGISGGYAALRERGV